MNRVRFDSPGWAQSGSSWARGHAHLDERPLDAAQLAATLDGCPTDDAWMAAIGRLNGCFAIATARAGRLLAAVDRIRSIPLFYAVDGEGCVLADNAYRLQPTVVAPAIDPTIDLEFRLTGYVTGRETLRSGVFQAGAGEAVIVDAGNPPPVAHRRYHAFRHDSEFAAPIADLVADLADLHVRVFRRLAASVGGRQLVVPLSGGFDSRLIGVTLRDIGLRDVVCYSYGVPGNWESRISRELARYLGFRWEFVPYSATQWRTWSASERFAGYFHAAGNLTSVPHIQDWPAVLELKGAARIDPEGVFVPGHSGDFLAGSHIPKWFAGRSSITRREVLDALQRAHYSLWDWPEDGTGAWRDAFDRRIETVVGPIRDGNAADAADVFERWDLQERQAKFICNSVRVYEDFGHAWRLPLFDSELMDFWARVPLDLRIGRRLYMEFARTRQALPITQANTDHGMLVRLAIAGIDRARLRPLAQRARRTLRRVRWERVYKGSSLAWLEIVEREHFRRTYTGNELMHSYLAQRYRDHAAAIIAGRQPR